MIQKKYMSRQPAVTTAECVGTCKSVLGEGCIMEDDGCATVVLWPAGELRAFISLSQFNRGVFFFSRLNNDEVYHELGFDRLQVLQTILTRHYLPDYDLPAGAGDV